MKKIEPGAQRAMRDPMYVQEAADAMGLHPETLRRWIRAGAPAMVSPTGHYIVSCEELLRWAIQRHLARRSLS